ncbi:MAG: 5-methylcytosine-specific restriction endonuclease system specificity protein McrC [Pseudomonadota bacterium]
MIPVENIYFLLCYAWNRFDEGDMAAISSLKFDNAADLLGHVLYQGVGRLFKKGLDRGYLEREELLSTLRGRIDINQTARFNLHRGNRAFCRFDEFEYDILQNRIIKSTIRLLLRTDGLDISLREQLFKMFRRMSGISEIELSSSVFSHVIIHRNNSFYGFLLDVCEFIFSCAIPDEQQGKYAFTHFLRDETRMRLLFQQFVFNFYTKEQTRFVVKSDRISWPAEALLPGREDDLRRLPGMETDISLHSTGKSIIIDTKYYADVLKSKYEGLAKVNSGNLYQIYAYLRSLEVRGFPVNQAEGVLLYPTNGYEVDLGWKISGHLIKVRTIDLGLHWREISDNLLGIIGVEPPVKKRQ